MFPGAGYDSNIFLVTGMQPILIDAGSGSGYSRLLNDIEKVTDHISKIILTHCHFDHAGGAAELSKHFNATVFIHERDAAAVRNGLTKETAADVVYYHHLLLFLGAMKYPNRSVHPNVRKHIFHFSSAA